ncbi:MAG: hypothetical protein ACD_39C01500G0004 [uncultured bacterium]|nr:MAG: hypothetical protein ACD_39C01500G0004 [uncultured bacterium]
MPKEQATFPKPHKPRLKEKTRPLFFCKADEFSNCGGGPYQAIFSSNQSGLYLKRSWSDEHSKFD